MLESSPIVESFLGGKDPWVRQPSLPPPDVQVTLVPDVTAESFSALLNELADCHPERLLPGYEFKLGAESAKRWVLTASGRLSATFAQPLAEAALHPEWSVRLTADDYVTAAAKVETPKDARALVDAPDSAWLREHAARMKVEVESLTIAPTWASDGMAPDPAMLEIAEALETTDLGLPNPDTKVRVELDTSAGPSGDEDRRLVKIEVWNRELSDVHSSERAEYAEQHGYTDVCRAIETLVRDTLGRAPDVLTCKATHVEILNP